MRNTNKFELKLNNNIFPHIITSIPYSLNSMLNNIVTCTSGVSNFVVQPEKKQKAKSPIKPKQQSSNNNIKTRDEEEPHSLFLQTNLTEQPSLYILPSHSQTYSTKWYQFSTFFNFQFLTLEFELASSSRRLHRTSRFDWVSPSLDSASLNFFMHSSKRFGSWSEKSLRTLRVRLRTAWFQWDRAFRSSAGKMIGRMTLWFCLIRLSMWSLFHKNNALSATYKQGNGN